MNDQIKIQYDKWQHQDLQDQDLITELVNIQSNEKEIQDCFYKDLEFGTGGLRGVIGVGTNKPHEHLHGSQSNPGLCKLPK